VCSFDTTNSLHTTCCHTKWENPPGGDVRNGPTKDECLPNGLCRNRGMSTIAGREVAPWTHYYRVYCTNQDWSGCLPVCDTGVSGSEARNSKLLIIRRRVQMTLVRPRLAMGLARRRSGAVAQRLSVVRQRMVRRVL